MLFVTSQILMYSQSLPLRTRPAALGSATGVFSMISMSSNSSMMSLNIDRKKDEELFEEDEERSTLLKPETCLHTTLDVTCV